MNVTFTIHHPKNKTSMLLTNISWDGNRLQISSGISITPKNWNKQKGLINRMEKNAMEKNAFLKKLKTQITDFYYEKKVIGKDVTKDELKQKVKEIIKPGKKKRIAHKSFFYYYNEFIKERKKIFSESTIKVYEQVLQHLKNFKRKTGYNVTFDSINGTFYNMFRHYLHTKGGDNYDPKTPNEKKNCSNNTVHKIIKTLKTFLNDCYEKGIIKNQDYKQYLKTGKGGGDTPSQKVSLSEADIKKIIDYEPETEKLKKIKDLFIIQLFTTMRVSDLFNLKPENIDLDKGIIYFYQVKTRGYIEIPIDPIKDILKKYDGIKLPKFEPQTYNRYLKELLKNAGLDAPIVEVKYYGDKRVEKTIPKYEAISSHNARITGITMLSLWGMIPEDIMHISGHLDRKSLDKYVKRSKEEAKNRYKEIMMSKF